MCYLSRLCLTRFQLRLISNLDASGRHIQMSCQKCWRRKLHQLWALRFFGSSFQRSDLKKQRLATTQNQQILSLKKTHQLREKFECHLPNRKYLTQKTRGKLFQRTKNELPGKNEKNFRNLHWQQNH